VQKALGTSAVVGVIAVVVVLVIVVGWFSFFRKPAPLPPKSTVSMQGKSVGGGVTGHGPIERKGDIN
jgi:uncharacterized membrane protein YqiK